MSEGEAVGGVDELVGEGVEVGGVGEEERVVVSDSGEVGVGGGSAELFEVVFGLVPECSHEGFLSHVEFSHVEFM